MEPKERSPKEQSLAFLRALYRELPEDQSLKSPLWLLADKRPRWFEVTAPDGIEQMATEAQRLSKDVYVGMSLYREPPAPYESADGKVHWPRGDAETSNGIVGCWVDVDIFHPVHKKRDSLPPTREAGMEVIRSAGLAPTVLIDSGHGYQAWWLLAEPLILDTREQRAEASRLVLRWAGSIAMRARTMGYGIDSTFDLARVLRIPGTINHKSTPVPVRLLEINEQCYYDLHHFEEHMMDLKESYISALATSSALVRRQTGTLVLDANASPPRDKLEALRVNLDNAGDLVDRRSKKQKDKSPSGWDMSVAVLCASVGWTDQEIVDLLVQCRRNHGDDLKLGREDYYVRTLVKARQSIARDEAVSDIEAARQELHDDKTPNSEGGSCEARKKICAALSEILEIEVLRVVKYVQDPPTFRIGLPNGAFIPLGSTQDLMNQAKTRAALAAASNHVPPRFKGEMWDEIVVQALIDAAEPQSTDEVATEEGRFTDWIEEYLVENPPTDNLEHAATNQHPVINDGNVYISVRSFRRWLQSVRGQKIADTQITEILKVYSKESRPFSFRLHGKPTTLRMWLVPPRVATYFLHPPRELNGSAKASTNGQGDARAELEARYGNLATASTTDTDSTKDSYGMTYEEREEWLDGLNDL